MNLLKRNILKQVASHQISQTEAKELLSELVNSQSSNNEVAIIGIAGKFPGAKNVDEFWSNLKNGLCTIDKFPDKRLNDFPTFSENPEVSIRGAFWDEIDKFDPAFFRISPKESLHMDPSQRILLETAYEVIEDAGYGGNSIYGTRTGVFVGTDHTNASPYIKLTPADELSATGSWTGILATRISYIFNLQGPGLVVDTACSSGATAVHLACQSLKLKECDMAIAAGICIVYQPGGGDLHSALKLVESADGKVRAFDKNANGTAWGEGVGAVLLKPLQQAIKDRDNIYAVIKGSSLNNDGASNGITAPSADAQEKLLVEAWKSANVDPKTISYIEAHGTGTILGDPVEIKGLTNAFRRFTDKNQFCRIGSVKTNIGHTVAASGIASLLKVVLALKHREIPASLNYHEANPHINFSDSPVIVNDQLTSWTLDASPRRAGINAFGFSGTNCHIVLEEAPELPNEDVSIEKTEKILLLSAKSKVALKELVKKYSCYLSQKTDSDINDICYTANTGRGHYNLRLAFVFNSIEQLKFQINSVHKNFDEIILNNVYYGECKVVYGNKDKLNTGELTQTQQQSITRIAMDKLGEYRNGLITLDFLNTMAQCYIKGAEIPWAELYKHQKRNRVNLPVYPFDRIKYWPEKSDQRCQSFLKNNLASSYASSEITNFNVSPQLNEIPTVILSGNEMHDYTLVEQQLAQIWGRELGINKMSVHDNFYDLGGDSIVAIKIANSINQSLGKKVTINDLLQYTTIFELSKELEYATQESVGFGSKGCGIEITEQVSYNLSHAQKRMWLLQKFDPEMTVNNISGVVPLDFEVDIVIFNKAINALICHHTMLRTMITEEMGEPRQVILPKLNFDLEVIDLTLANDREHHLRKLVHGLNQKHFDLSIAPLFRMKLFKCSQNKYEFYINIHHIITDGWSMRLCMQELMEMYHSYLKGIKVNILPIKPDYTDWIRQQEEWENSNEFKLMERYWLEEIAKPLPVLNLPADFPRLKKQTYNGNSVTFTLSQAQTSELKILARKLNITLHMMLMAEYFILLHKITNDEEIIVGFPITGRDKKEIEKIIGLFVNTLCIRVEFDKLNTFKDLALYVKEKCLKSYQHSKYPFELLVSKINPERDMSRNPIFSTIFEFYENIGSGNEGVTNFDLCFFGRESEKNDIEIRIEYNTDLFKKETVQRFVGFFDKITNQIIERIDITFPEIGILAQEEKRKLLVEWCGTNVESRRDKTVHQLFEEQVERTPDHEAVVFKGKGLTYRELNEKANQLAHYLRKRDVKAETLVAICVERSLEMVVGILGILKAGGAYVPIDPNYPQDRLTYMLVDTNASIVITQESLIKCLPANKAEVICLDRDWVNINEGSKVNPQIEITSNNLAYVIYTSGSTGVPKGSITCHSNILRIVKEMNYVTIGDDDILLQLSNFSFDGSIFDIFGALTNGAKLVLISKDEILNTTLLSNVLRDQHITILFMTTALFNTLIDIDVKCFIGVNKILFGGEQVSVQHVRRALFELGPKKLIHVYGPTETTVYATYYNVDEIGENDKTVPIGKPISGTLVYIVDKHMQIVPIGSTGELLIGGDGLSRGYLNRAELTGERFIDNPFGADSQSRLYRTGDLVRYLPDGNIEFVGRLDNQVKIRGFRVELGEIESKLLKHESIKEAVVIATENNCGTKNLCSYIVANIEMTVNTLREYLSQELPDYMIPSYFVQVEKLPLTPNGKIDRKALPEPDGNLLLTGTDYEAPRCEVEDKLVEIWISVLGTSVVGINDSFFALGGDSIKAIQVSARLQNQGLKMELADLFQHPTIGELSKYVIPIVNLVFQGEVEGAVELTPIQCWFYQQNFTDKHQFNQSVMLYRKGGFDENKLFCVFDRIVSHHDALRMVYRNDGQNVIQYNKRFIEGLHHLKVFDFTSDVEYKSKIELIANQFQQEINMNQGPLFKFVLFKTAEGDHLLLIIHHLVIDGISWRILFEELAMGYTNDNAAFPLKSHSFKEWSIKLKEYSNSKELLREKRYWQKLEKQNAAISPKIQGNSDGSTVRRNIGFKLSSDATEKLLKQVNIAYNTEINEILLVAFGQAIQKTTGQEKIFIELEGHGREAIIPGMNINRTIGWFTSVFPVLLDMSCNSGLAYLIKNTKENLRQIPNHGIGYGILKYLTTPENKQDLSFNLNPEITFNYLGQFDQDIPSDIFDLSPLSMGIPVTSKFNKFKKPVEVVGTVINRELVLSFDFDPTIYHDVIITALSENYQTALLHIIEHCVNKTSVEFTPSDFEDGDLSIEELEKIVKQVTNL